MAEKPVVLSVQNLKKTIGGKQLIHDISFDVRAGEVFGFLGPNGAGKTTTIRMLVGLIAPTAGTIRICDFDIQKQFVSAMKHVGCIVENPELYGFLSGWENLEQFARMTEGVTPERIKEVVRQVRLEERIHDRVKTYSLGMRQRLGIAQALLARPQLLILDEPTNGLDPVGIRELREFVRQLVEEEGLSVFISSHLLSEIEMMCDRVAIIHEGRSLYAGTVNGLTEKKNNQTVWRVNPVEAAFAVLTSDPEVQDAVLREDSIRCHVTSERIPQLNAKLVERGIDVFAIEPVSPSLEDLFLEITGGDRRA
ncbi:ABC transporter ATP-binding protein [Effusibacillus dendaii]|uniref:Bacitracin ABC transporter ATP-binding protein n=1 Tax=Effusibacillus dendaii TaxID=2743772 RepID=A0A7I8DFG2_9BACL|nr:ABC transporter ATP-binding protein [Effusibacillus dendaii]BCJ88052.1 bacitracin ABC transporter ATP-binding protein [Effusibacillus dendaii]